MLANYIVRARNRCLCMNSIDNQIWQKNLEFLELNEIMGELQVGIITGDRSRSE